MILEFLLCIEELGDTLTTVAVAFGPKYQLGPQIETNHLSIFLFLQFQNLQLGPSLSGMFLQYLSFIYILLLLVNIMDNLFIHKNMQNQSNIVCLFLQ